VRLLGISGSLRRDSLNTRLLHAAAQELPGGVTLEIWDGLRDIPPYDEDLEPERPAAVERLKEALSAADAVLVATPEYNGSFPGHLKNAFDWASRPLAESPLRNLPVAVVGASPSAFGAVWAQDDLRRVLGRAGARVVGEPVPVPRAHTRFDEDGRLADDEVREGLRGAVAALAREGELALVAA
jgi:chromate reductase, NAD(P)H dehydrogenase (quinone)